jgi:hypothetical protein
MNRAERLALAVRVHVAAVRAERAKRAAFEAEQRVQPMFLAWEEFERRHGRIPDGSRAEDRETVLRWFHVAGGGADEDPLEVLDDSIEADRLAAEALGEAAATKRALVDAWRAEPAGGGNTLFEWLGVNRAGYNRAVIVALEHEGLWRPGDPEPADFSFRLGPADERIGRN